VKAGAALLLLSAAWCGVGAADSTSPAEGMRLLSAMANAAREINYDGTFVYKYGNHIETSRIWHLNDASGSYERLETLDGPLREVVRRNDEVVCYYPDRKLAKVEKWGITRRFPAVVSEQLAAIMANYAVRKGAIERVAGHDCRVTNLDPRDQLRYGHSYCAEVNSGLPLRARTVNERGETVELFAFTQVEIGAAVSPEQVKSRYDPAAPGWKLDQSAMTSATSKGQRWTVLNHPAGFRKILETMRIIHGKQATQLVFSDGLAAFSVFVEPGIAGARAAQELAHQGAVNVFSRPHAGLVITALGEAPATTVMLFGNSVTVRSKP
jgi:sigma-E factor negative regulatory protein RseB